MALMLKPIISDTKNSTKNNTSIQNSEQSNNASWKNDGACGDGGLGSDYSGKQRIIGYLPTWIPDYDIKNKFNPEVVTNVNVSFLMFKQNNKDYKSNDFASIACAKDSRAPVHCALLHRSNKELLPLECNMS